MSIDARASSGGVARALGFDVGQRAAWRDARGGASWAPLTGAVLTAGAYRGGKPLHETNDETWELMLHANLETARVSLSELVPQLIATGGGSIVVVGSRAALRPWESSGAAAYAAAKAALLALVQTVAAEVLEQGVRLNAVLPSTMDTPDNRRAMPQADASRWVALSSVSDVIRFLLSDAARDVSGALLPVYGRA
jgi:NAD(P)-dependent dehydrogenase (short-subunit alcohol dehydrogenase family)